jgi:LuxR family transcriptional regulator, maltose regulon positive regulatory protein
MSLAVKSGRPLIHEGFVQRTRLLAKLTSDPNTPLVVVVAPAGYGKTSLVAEWAEREQRPSVWLALERWHNDAVRLIRAIVQVLQDVEPFEESLALAIDRAESQRLNADTSVGGLPPVVLSALAAGLERRHMPLVLILDDVQAITDAAALHVLDTVAEHLPRGSQLVLISRTRPSLPLGRLRAHKALLELGTQEMAMTSTEAAALLQAAHVSVGSGEVDALVRRTEGWPAGLYLAALSARDQSDPAVELERFYGNNRVVAEYLDDEFLCELSVEERELLVRASILERLSGALCDATLKRTGSALLLDRLAGSGLPLTPTDAGHEWFRCHRLLREALMGELHHDHPEHIPTLHLRASAWYAEHGDLDHAITHAVAAGDMCRAGELLWQSLPRHFSGRQGLVGMGKDAARAHNLADQDGPWCSMLCLLRGVADHLTGDRESARGHLERGIYASANTAPNVEALCLSQLAMISVEEGDWDRGVNLIARGVHQVQHHSLAGHPASALTFAVSAYVRSHVGHVDEGKRDARRASQLLTGLSNFIPWYEAETRIVLARAVLRLADVGAARALLAEASQFARRVPDATVFGGWLDDAWGLVDSVSATALAGPATLTMAELRILRFLPTHLSFREIGGRLHVSTNTVKTQAHAVYRKLDVRSRSDAVARAAEIGLLDG